MNYLKALYIHYLIDNKVNIEINYLIINLYYKIEYNNREFLSGWNVKNKIQYYFWMKRVYIIIKILFDREYQKLSSDIFIILTG